tara:strand:+ start:110 stop:358 length:249 start_codon:yes stop_codon:yes gene_type:complete
MVTIDVVNNKNGRYNQWMSSEQININTLENQKIIDVNITPKVDINFLISRARAEKRKENKLNYILFGIICAVILTLGIILSL